jgi:hypothetical protein
VLTSDGSTWKSTAPVASGVPYTGATGAVNLGAYDLTVNGVTLGRGNNNRDNNFAFGTNALASTIADDGTGAGNYNMAFGLNALKFNTTGKQNSAFGEIVLQSNIGGSFNTAMGIAALTNNTSGSYNTGLGNASLFTNTTGSNNTALGYEADVSSNNLLNATAIGYKAKVYASNAIQLGNADITNVSTYGTLTLKDVTNSRQVTYPNTHNATAGQVLTTDASGLASWATPSSGGAGSGGHYVGEVYGGGIVFYVTPGGFHGLIASSTRIGGTVVEFLDRVTDPTRHSTTTNGENLYVDWVAPSLSQLRLLYDARNTAGLNLGGSKYYSSTIDPWDLQFYKYIDFSNGNSGITGFNHTDVDNGIAIRIF